MNRAPSPIPLSALQMLLLPLLLRFASDENKEVLERRAKYTNLLRTRQKAKAQLDKELYREAKLYMAILRDTWTRLGSHSPRHAPSGPESMPQANTRRRRVERVRFEYVKCSAEIIYFKVLTRKVGLFGYYNALPYRVRVWDLIEPETLQELSFACERVVTASYEDPRKGAWIRVHRLEGVGGLPTRVTFDDMLEHYPLAKLDQAPIIIGVADHRKVQTVYLSHIPHFLVAGSSGSGKSNIVNHILCSLIRFLEPSQLQLILIDLKRMEFNYYEGLPHLKQEVIFTPEDAIKALKECMAEIGKRTELFSAAKVKELSAWNKKNPDQTLPRWILVIDEFAELMLASGPQVAKEVESLITRITNLGRSVGIHALICTQRPAVAVVPNSIKINMPLILAGRTPTASQSSVILGNGSASNLPAIPGRMIALTGSNQIEIQTPYMPDSTVEEIVAIAKGKALKLVQSKGIDIVINDAGLLASVIKDNGSLAIKNIYDRVKPYGITVNQCKAWLNAVVQVKRVEVDGLDYEIIRAGNGYHIVQSKVEVVEVAAPDPKIVALEMMREIRKSKEKTS